ncbi:hypothetical protein [uncultured Mameliella sp.]|uniref:hypothetical protein n=1 Tax=uncultured Mameliella sp. TaxID=1447087 RepID=UPI002620B12B|nr:hypothetical protein [uncultured Mameliella sp.]
MQITFILACEDSWGGAEGDERHQEVIASEDVVNSPMWNHANFGRKYLYTSGPYAGGTFRAAKVIRYRIRKPRGLTMLERLARDATSPQEVIA